MISIPDSRPLLVYKLISCQETAFFIEKNKQRRVAVYFISLHVHITKTGLLKI